MSKAKITRINPTEQAPQNIPLTDVRLTWTPLDYWGDTAQTRTIDGAMLARLLRAVPETLDASHGHLGMHLDALRVVLTAIFWVLAQYVDWLKLEQQWGSADSIMKVIKSATVTIGAAAEEVPS